MKEHEMPGYRPEVKKTELYLLANKAAMMPGEYKWVVNSEGERLKMYCKKSDLILFDQQLRDPDLLLWLYTFEWFDISLFMPVFLRVMEMNGRKMVNIRI